MSAAANAYASVDLPDPGGPVMSHAWVIDSGSDAAPCRVATASSCPQTASHGTPTDGEAGAAATAESPMAPA